jgi:holin-like protein
MRVRGLRVVLGLGALAAIDLLGEWIAKATSAPIPGNVLGMLLLAALLALRVVPLKLVEEGADLLLKWLALLFVPAAVSVARYWGLIRGELVGIAVVTVTTTILVMVVTGMIAERAARNESNEGNDSNETEGA